MAPAAIQGTSAKKNRSPDAGAVVDGKFFDIEYHRQKCSGKKI